MPYLIHPPTRIRLTEKQKRGRFEFTPNHKKKRKALDLFSRHLLSSPEGKNVGKIILFGSLNRGEVRDGSDIDVLILASDNLSEMEKVAADAALETGMEVGESVEPLVYCLDEMRYPGSYFLYSISRNGKEIYSMDETQIIDKLPASHGGVVIKFSKIYIKEGPVDRKRGRVMNKGLALRNKSRYDHHALIGNKEAKEVLKLTEDMIKLLDKELD